MKKRKVRPLCPQSTPRIPRKKVPQLAFQKTPRPMPRCQLPVMKVNMETPFLKFNDNFVVFTAFERPLSSLTAASECSSTISSEDEADEKQDSDEVISPPPPPPITDGVGIQDDTQFPPPPISPTDSSISGDGDTWQTPTNNESPKSNPSTKSGGVKFGNLFTNMKIPKFKFKRNSESISLSSEESKPTSPVKKVDQTPPEQKKPERSASRQSSFSGVTSSGYGRMNRSRSASGDQINAGFNSFSRGSKERHSYRAPSATSRYMQAAEAYAAKNREARSNSKSDPRSFWGPNGRGREGSASSGFYPPKRSSSRNSNLGSRPASRTTSASPGPTRRRTLTRGDSSNALQAQIEPTSTHSTPCKRPQQKVSSSSSRLSTSSKSNQALADIEAEDDLILKRMEEILLTYKSKVEDHLAAEGRELPKEIFEDFTSQWVQNSVRSSSSKSGLTQNVRTTPMLRKERRDGSEKTRIPMPTYFSNSSPKSGDDR